MQHNCPALVILQSCERGFDVHADSNILSRSNYIIVQRVMPAVPTTSQKVGGGIMSHAEYVTAQISDLIARRRTEQPQKHLLHDVLRLLAAPHNTVYYRKYRYPHITVYCSERVCVATADIRHKT